ncbi:MAG: ATP synthase F1 subunit gamma [Bdellovibrionales bacterium CG10_big_fil_rev_8_21_14_0_10_45_34]|nr:MAG: ATP synthase F1 subunit gamma [Bdellovibrionales bacterium CG10_big_fil_rev_8_21_14_0_10_45_34]
MPNTKDIRAKISSTSKTQQTTKAMKMVAAAKLRRAQLAIINARPYANKIYQIIRRMALVDRIQHPLLLSTVNEASAKKVLLVVLTSDRGLCGGFNSGINKYARNYLAANRDKKEKIDFFFIGRKGQEFFRRFGIAPVHSVTQLGNEIKYPVASEISETLWHHFLDGEYDEIRLVYNEFKSALNQIVIDERLLPIEIGTEAEKEFTEYGFSKDFIFEPSVEGILDELVKKHFAIQIFRVLQESLASEHGARMTAMENATKNAAERIRSLTLTYNKVRQAAITTELIEITSGAEALNG